MTHVLTGRNYRLKYTFEGYSQEQEVKSLHFVRCTICLGAIEIVQRVRHWPIFNSIFLLSSFLLAPAHLAGPFLDPLVPLVKKLLEGQTAVPEKVS